MELEFELELDELFELELELEFEELLELEFELEFDELFELEFDELLELEFDELFELEFEELLELEFDELFELESELEFDEVLELEFELEFDALIVAQFQGRSAFVVALTSKRPSWRASTPMRPSIASGNTAASRAPATGAETTDAASAAAAPPASNLVFRPLGCLGLFDMGSLSLSISDRFSWPRIPAARQPQYGERSIRYMATEQTRHERKMNTRLSSD